MENSNFFLTNVFSGFCYFSSFQSTVDALIAPLIFQLRNGATALAVCFLIPRWALWRKIRQLPRLIMLFHPPTPPLPPPSFLISSPSPPFMINYSVNIICRLNRNISVGLRNCVSLLMSVDTRLQYLLSPSPLSLSPSLLHTYTHTCVFTHTQACGIDYHSNSRWVA